MAKKEKGKTVSATLFIDSAYDSCSAGICRQSLDDAVLRHSEMRYGQAEVIMPMIDDILTEAKIKPADLSEIVVNIGPGRFTGIRLAIAAAMSLALPFDTALSGITGMRCYALRYFLAHPDKTDCVVALASGRGNFFVQHMFADFKKESEIQDISPKEINGFCHAFGRDVPVITDNAQALDYANVVELAPLKPADMIGLWLFQKTNNLPFSPVRPLYVRPPDVSLPKRG